MAEFLSQDEIDALLGIASEEVEEKHDKTKYKLEIETKELTDDEMKSFVLDMFKIKKVSKLTIVEEL
jgi:flagellar motor switch protein FliM